MPHKDWKLGEYRIKTEIVYPDGSSVKCYIPHVAKDLGKRLSEAIGEIATSRPFEGYDDDTIVSSSFCNQAHRLKDGVPSKHECYVLPICMLLAEHVGDTEEAVSIAARTRKTWGKHNGVEK